MTKSLPNFTMNDTSLVTSDLPVIKLNVEERTQEEEPLKIEDVFESLGGYSWFQLWITCLLIFPEIPASMIVTSPAFTGSSNVPFTCLSNGQRLDTNNSLFSNSTVYTGLDSFICNSNCSARQPFGTPITSVVQEWDLVCDRAWITDTCHSLHMGGMMAGSFFGAIVSDRFGRKKAFYLMTLFMGIFGIASGLVPDVYSYAVTRFLSGIGTGGYYVVYNIYIIEFLTPSWRTLCGCLSLWFFGEILLTLLAYLIPSWRILTIATSLPVLIMFLVYPLIPESPRWLLCQGRLLEASKAFNQVARWNSRPEIESQTMRKLQESILSEERQNETKSGLMTDMAEVFRSSKLSVKLAVFVYSWFAVALVYYGITFNVKNLSGDPYWNLIYMGLFDFIGFPFGAIFNNWFGRKKTLSFCLILGALFLVGLVAAEKSVGLTTYPLLITILCLMGKFGVAAAWGVVTCFTAESFPTVVRSTCLGFCSLAANVGGVLAPQLAFLGIMYPALPYYVFCGITVLAAGLSCILTETNRKDLKNFVG